MMKRRPLEEKGVYRATESHMKHGDRNPIPSTRAKGQGIQWNRVGVTKPCTAAACLRQWDACNPFLFLFLTPADLLEMQRAHPLDWTFPFSLSEPYKALPAPTCLESGRGQRH